MSVPRCFLALMIAVVAVTTACGGGSSTSAPSTGRAAPFPTESGVLTDDQARAVFARAAEGLSEQRTTAVNFAVERVDGQPMRQVLNPTMRLDLRDAGRPIASLALSILASNVAVGGEVYRQEADPGGTSTVWVRDPEQRTPLEFALFKPGSPKAKVIGLGTEEVAGRRTRHFRVFDPGSYAGPTTAPVAPPSSPATATTPTTPTESGAGDYDDFWFAEDGQLVRMSTVMGQLRLTSARIEYGGDLQIKAPDTSKAISAEEYERRKSGH